MKTEHCKRNKKPVVFKHGGQQCRKRSNAHSPNPTEGEPCLLF
jgi:hypothetical protein